MSFKDFLGGRGFVFTKYAEDEFGSFNQFQHIGTVVVEGKTKCKLCICRACSKEGVNHYVEYSSRKSIKCGCIKHLTDQGVRCMNKTPSQYKTWPEFQNFALPRLVIRNAYKSSRGAYDCTLICPVCFSDKTVHKGNIRRGCTGCDCVSDRTNQQEGYINIVKDATGKIVCFKFGIAKDSKQRVSRQNNMSEYEVSSYEVYKFKTPKDCKKAEQECKQEIVCGIVSKEEMPDGYTETTSPTNLTTIQRIYERNGGVLKDEATR